MADDNSSRMFYPAFGHDLRETVPHVPVPALETVAIARVMGDFHGVTIINNNVAEELTEDSTITRGSEIVTGMETGVVFRIGGSRTLYLDRSSRIRFNVLNWFDGDLLVQVEHLEGILINDVAGQIAGSSVHETVIRDENGEQFEVGVLGASYMTYINPSNLAPEEVEQHLAEFSEAYGEDLNLSVNSSDDALVFFFEGAGTVRRGEQLVEIVVGEGAILSEGEVNVSRFPLERISSLPPLAQNFKEHKRIDVERLAEIDHRSDPIIRDKLEQLNSHGFASDKPFFDELSFYEFAVVIEALPEETSDYERHYEQAGSEISVDEGSRTIVQNNNEEDSNRITDILVEWSARGESPEVTEPHEETAILLREDEPGDSELPENDDDGNDNPNPNEGTGIVNNYNPNPSASGDVETESSDYVNINGADEVEVDDGNYNGEAHTGLRAIYPQLSNGNNTDNAADTGSDYVRDLELNGLGNNGDSHYPGERGTSHDGDSHSDTYDYGPEIDSDPAEEDDDTIYDPIEEDGIVYDPVEEDPGTVYDPANNNNYVDDPYGNTEGDGTGVIIDPNDNTKGDGTGVIYDPSTGIIGDGINIDSILNPNGSTGGDGTGIIYDPSTGIVGDGVNIDTIFNPNNNGNSDNYGYNGVGSDNNGYNYNPGSANNGYNYNTGSTSNSYSNNTGSTSNGYSNNTGATNNGYNYNTGATNNGYNYNTGATNNGYNYNTGATNNGYNYNTGATNNGYNYNTGATNNGYNNNTGATNNGYNDNTGSTSNSGGNYRPTGTGNRGNVTTPDLYMRP